MSEPAVTLLISLNDLEAFEIARCAAGRADVEVRNLKLAWGESPDAALHAIPIATLAPVVILVECPSPAYEAAARASGRIVHVVDHHLRCRGDGSIMDRRSRRSALEQVAELLGLRPLDREQRLIAANDSGFWPGLYRELSASGPIGRGAFLKAALEIRERDIGASIASRKGAKKVSIAGARSALSAARKQLAAAIACGDAVMVRPQAHKSGPTDPVLYLIQTTEAADRGSYLSDAVYLHRLESASEGPLTAEHFAVEICILTTSQAGHPQRLFLSGGGALGDELPHLISLIHDRPDGSDCQIYAGAGANSAFLGVSAPRDISGIADAVLGERLQGSRPLERFCTQFVQALRVTSPDWRAPADLTPLVPVQSSAQALAYFSPPFRRRLGGAGAPPSIDDTFDLGTYELPAIARITVHWGACPEEGEPARPVTECEVNRIRVHLGPERVLFIEWVVGGGKANLDQSPFWRQLLHAHRVSERNPRDITTLADLLDFNEAARFVASAFSNPSKQRAVSLTIGEATETLEFGLDIAGDLSVPAGWFRLMLDRALAPVKLKSDDIEILFDARARSVHAAVPTGPRPQTPAGIAREDIMFARMTGVDEYGPESFYDRQFNQRELESWRYRRFADSGTHFAASGFSFAMLGYGGFAAGYLTENFWFGLTPPGKVAVAARSSPGAAALGHVQSLYFPMFLLTQRHLVTFDALALEHSEAIRLRGTTGDVESAIAASIEKIRALRGRLTDYLASLWFDDVSPELQGQDLYRLMLKRSGARRSFERLRVAIVDADAIEADRQERRIAEEAERAQRQRDSIALLGTAVATPLLLASLFGPVLMLFAETGATGQLVERDGVMQLSLGSAATYFDFGRLHLSAGVTYSIAGAVLVLATFCVMTLRERATLARNGDERIWSAVRSLFSQIRNVLRPRDVRNRSSLRGPFSKDSHNMKLPVGEVPPILGNCPESVKFDKSLDGGMFDELPRR